MPSLSVIQLDRLIEPGPTTKTAHTTSFPNLDRRNTTSLPLDIIDTLPPHRPCNPVATTPQFNNNNDNNNNNVTVIPHMSPWLYSAPEQTPLPISPTSSYSPSSRFLINHKRRGPRLAKSIYDQNVIGEVEAEEKLVAVDNRDFVVEEEEEANEGENGGMTEVGEGKNSTQSRELMRFWSSIDGWDESSSANVATPMAEFSTPMADFYDAWEELSSDSGHQAAQRSLSDAETELRELRLTLLMEIENRKLVEEALHSMQSLWQILKDKLGAVGVVLPPDLANLGLSEDICRQIQLLRFVSESIGKGIAKTEVEAEMKAQLEAKNFEISRLGDRLHYYETVNKELCQMNQEAVENARRDRQIKKRRQKWVWGSIVTAITLGSAALAWSSLPSEKGSSSTKLPEASEQ
ncbi:uncharacterized protein LOC141639003 [Silene latifolia]|uniref:uncharacterized protein LOC141639003 n=1 Tax=Silene latifolia TaxID=37657 RepID=UPI003D77F980